VEPAKKRLQVTLPYGQGQSIARTLNLDATQKYDNEGKMTSVIDKVIRTDLGIEVTDISKNVSDKLQLDCFPGFSGPIVWRTTLTWTKLLRVSIATLAVAWMVNIAPRLRGQADDSNLPRATVHVTVFNCFGARIQAPEIRLSSRDGKRDFTPLKHDSVIAGVPYGYYVILASDNGGGLAKRELTVNTEEVWVRVGLSFPAGDRLWPAGDLSITGDIRPVPKGEKWWVKVEGVFLHVSREGPVLRTGGFSIGGLEMGTYLVEVFDGSKLRHAETVEIDTKQPKTHLRISIPPSQ
jgi:hypothetical protein